MNNKKPYEFKTVYNALRDQYEAKSRMLRVYKISLQSSITRIGYSDPELTPSERELHLESLVDLEIVKNITKIKRELRNIHLARSFIKGVPYSKVENRNTRNTPLTSFPNSVEVLQQFSLPCDYTDLLIGFVNWVNSDHVPSFFEKPVREDKLAVLRAAIEEGLQSPFVEDFSFSKLCEKIENEDKDSNTVGFDANGSEVAC